jgi:iron complex outermembrane receptor protein
MKRCTQTFSVSAVLLALPIVSIGQVSEPSSVTLETVIVTDVNSLNAQTPTGTRLGLSRKDTPATVDAIDAHTMADQGYQTVRQAVQSLPGITAASSPANLAQYSMRGFSNEQVMLLNDGVYIGPPNMVGRPQNTFNLAEIEVLKGPASVLYGEGAIGGTINLISKKPSLGETSADGMLGVGSFGSVSVGAGGNVPLSETVAIRADFSRSSIDGYVDRGHADSLSGSGSLLWKPNAGWTILFLLDVLHDHPSDYFGVPLLPATATDDPLHGVVNAASGLAVDARTRYRNYNVGDADNQATQYFPRAVISWTPTQALTVENTLYYIYAQRDFVNAETYLYDPVTGRVDRDRFFVFHDQHLVGDRLATILVNDVFGLSNRLVTGIDYSHLDFIRTRGFPDGDSVSLLDPLPGTFGSVVTGLRSPTHWDDSALFFEDALDLSPSLKLVTGARGEWLWLNRENYDADGNFQASSSFRRTYDLFNWRLGMVYAINDVWSLYGQYTTGKDPVDANIFLVNADENFKPSDSRQAEIGIKANGEAGELTLALYDIHRDNLLTLIGPDTIATSGSQRSKGFEIMATHHLAEHWSVDANAAWTQARYGSFVDQNVGVDASGNVPLNVPKWVASVGTRIERAADLPLAIGGTVRYVSQRYANFANTTIMPSYATTDLFATYALSANTSLTLRIANLFNRTYAQWADPSYPSELLLGAPRSYEFELRVHY